MPELNDSPGRDVRSRDELISQALVDRELITELQGAGVVDADTIENLEAAIRTARNIGAAVGIVMERRKLSQAEAFAVLVEISQAQNRKLRQVAETVVETGQL